MSNAQMNDKPVAVVTGGARGRGEAAVRKFAALGYRVAALDVNKDRGLALERELGPERVRFFECDVSDAGAVEALADRCQQDLGPADFLVAAAGLFSASFASMTRSTPLPWRMTRNTAWPPGSGLATLPVPT